MIDTTEMYLRTIYQLREEKVVPMRARIADALDHSGPTVSQTVGRMERDGLVYLAADRHIEMTPAGQAKAMRVMRKHRLAERLLVEVIRLPWPKVHDEACRWEHVMSDEVERRLVQILAPPFVTPYGLAVPGLDEIGYTGPGLDPPHGTLRSALMLAQVPEAMELALAAVGESIQADLAVMEQLDEAGLRPGRTINLAVDQATGWVVLTSADSGEGVQLPPAVAQHILVGSASGS